MRTDWTKGYASTFGEGAPDERPSLVCFGIRGSTNGDGDVTFGLVSLLLLRRCFVVIAVVCDVTKSNTQTPIMAFSFCE